MTRHPLAERDPAPEQPWEPTSSTWAREEAKRRTAEAVTRAKDARKQPAPTDAGNGGKVVTR